MTLKSWVEFVRHEDRREDHKMFGVLRLRTDDSTRRSTAAGCIREIPVRSGPTAPTATQDRVQGDKRPGDEMLNEDGLMWIGAATKRHPNQRRGAN